MHRFIDTSFVNQRHDLRSFAVGVFDCVQVGHRGFVQHVVDHLARIAGMAYADAYAEKFTAAEVVDDIAQAIVATVAAAISEMDVNISNVDIEEHDSKYSSIIFTIAVRDRVHLARVMRHIRAIDMVVRISRKKG